MSISNVSDLRTEVVAYAKRSDITSRLDTFIQLAEADINREMLADFSLFDAGSNGTNWLLDTCPDVYLFGTLAQVAVWAHDAEKVAEWGALYQRALEQAHYRAYVESGDGDAKLRTEIGADAPFDIVTGR